MKKSVRKIMFNRRKLKREREKKTRAVVKLWLKGNKA